MFNLLQHKPDGSPDVHLTSGVLGLKYEDSGLDELPHLVGITLQVAKLIADPPEEKRMAQHLWLFELAGRLKGGLSDELRADESIGTRLAPLSLLLVDALEAFRDLPAKTRKKRIQWNDADAVMLEFEEIWYKRKFPKGSPFLEEAVEASFRNPLGLTGNVHFVRLLNVAYYLQQTQPGLPILLPISERLASLLQTTPVTLGTAIARAVREGYLEIVDSHYNLKAGKARSFKVNLDHPMLKDRLSRGM